MISERKTFYTISELKAAIVVSLVFVALFIVFLLLAPWVIKHAYNNELPLAVLNNTIRSDTSLSLDHYISYANSLAVTFLPILYCIAMFLLILGYHGKNLFQDTGVYSNYKTIPVTIIIILVIYAYYNRFLQDDAFISFRYANNLVNGHGLNWNPGESPVEGYSNFLWTLYIAFLFCVNLDPAIYVQVTGLLLYTITLVIFYKLARLLLADSYLAIFSLIILGLNYTFSSYATGGIETQLQVVLTLSVAWIALRSIQAGSLSGSEALAVSVLSAASLLTRMDSVVLVVVFYIGILTHNIIKRKSIYIWLIVPLVFIYIIYTILRINYYGQLLPNTFYAKVSGFDNAYNGVKYIFSCLWRYGYIPLLLYSFINTKKLVSKTKWGKTLFAVVVSWLCYIIWVGGCFMEYRFMVAILPYIVIIIVQMVMKPIHRNFQRILLVVLVALSILHSLTFNGEGNIESVKGLNNWILAGRWPAVGMTLGKLFGEADSEITIATTAAGAIPYYSNLRTIDMLGLNDAWIAHNGFYENSSKPGHQRYAPTQYLIDQRVNIVVGHPQIRQSERYIYEQEVRYTDYINNDLPIDSLPDGARFIEIPIDDNYKLIVLYLVQNDCIDAVIDELELKTHNICLQDELPERN